MTRIKTFEFEISNVSRDADSDISQRARECQARRLTSPDEIDRIINLWIESNHAKVVDIKVNPYLYETHNNSMPHWEHIIYTIIYDLD